MRRRAAWLLGGLLACRPTATEAPSADAAATHTGVADAAEDAGPAREPTDDLLHHTEATVTVSSRVDNPRDFPEHLVDGKAETAWNGKTGDLGGWIEITVPAEATATAIALTAGFDKGGLFEANHRIARLLLSRDGKTTKEVRLDVNVRAPQRIAIDDPRPGGTYRLQVLETKPGTKTAWEELVVSELAVYGRAGKARVPTHLPKVTVAPGSAPPPHLAAPGEPAHPERRTGKSVPALCAAWTADLSRALAKELPPESRLPPTCAEEAKVPTVTGPPPEWKRLRAVRFAWFDGVLVRTHRHLVLEREDGTVVVGPEYEATTDLGCFGTQELLAAAFDVRGEEMLLARTLLAPQAAPSGPEGQLVDDGATLEQDLVRCRIGTFTCRPPETLSTRELTQAEVGPARKAPPTPRFAK